MPSLAILNNENLLSSAPTSTSPCLLILYLLLKGKYSSGIYDHGEVSPPSLAAKFKVFPIIESGTVTFQFLVKSGTLPVAIPSISTGSVFGLTWIPDNVGLFGSTEEFTRLVLPNVSSTNSDITL